MDFLKTVLRGRKIYFPRYSIFLFLAGIFILAYFYNYHNTLTIRPQGPHLWRQSDCLSFTGSFYHGEADFFHPRIYNLLNDNEGKSMSEFPIVYYTVAQLWKIFGKHEWIYRLINFIISVLGMSAVFKMIESRIRDSFWSLFTALLLFTSGIYVYYTLNFLSNITAFNLVLIGWYFFFRFEATGKNIPLYLSFGFFLLAGLLKISSAMSYIAIGTVFLLEWSGLKTFNKSRRIFPQPLAVIIPALLIAGIWVTWYLYAHRYNEQGNSGVFLVGILPIWKENITKFKDIIDKIWKIGVPEYFYPRTQLLFILMLTGLVFLARKTAPLLNTIVLLLGLAFVSFILLFFGALDFHAYYVIDLLIFAVFILFTFTETVLKTRIGEAILNSYLTKALALVFLIVNINHTVGRLNDYYNGWWNQKHKTELYGYDDIEPYLDSIGITRDQKVITLNDNTINASLYLMDRKGWTGYGTNMKDSNQVAGRISMGAAWLMVHNSFPEGPEYSHWKYFIKGQAGEHENIKIYRIGMPEGK
jgi:hypothetical protein